jgi:hypothetical protein
MEFNNADIDTGLPMLPAPAGNFNLTMRFYGPQTPVLDGTYRLPDIKRVN